MKNKSVICHAEIRLSYNATLNKNRIYKPKYIILNQHYNSAKSHNYLAICRLLKDYCNKKYEKQIDITVTYTHFSALLI